jgi:hypothetical protein
VKDLNARAMKKLKINKNLAHKKPTLLKIHQMIILPTLRYGDAAYGSASPTTLNTLDPVHHKGIRLALETFTVCRKENVLHEAGISTLTEIREQVKARIVIRVKVTTFADDTAIFVPNSEPINVYDGLQSQLNSFMDSFKQWKIKVNASKTQANLFH